jgi:hypothetical protein
LSVANNKLFWKGGIPYVGASVTTIWLAREANLAIHGIAVGIDPGVALTVLDQALNLQVTYGAVMLSFLGMRISLLLSSITTLVLRIFH